VTAALRVSVNLSARQLPEQDLTETAMMQDPENATTTLNQLDWLGVHIAIDDFGTGYSSLSHLKQFPI